jgi:hypothetical protein
MSEKCKYFMSYAINIHLKHWNHLNIYTSYTLELSLKYINYTLEPYKYTNNGTYINHLHNNLLIRTTCFDPNGSSSGVPVTHHLLSSYNAIFIRLHLHI